MPLYMRDDIRNSLMSSMSHRLEAMQTECLSALRTQRMPTTRNEEYRFTDVGPLLQIQPEVRPCSFCPVCMLVLRGVKGEFKHTVTDGIILC